MACSVCQPASSPHPRPHARAPSPPPLRATTVQKWCLLGTAAHKQDPASARRQASLTHRSSVWSMHLCLSPPSYAESLQSRMQVYPCHADQHMHMPHRSRMHMHMHMQGLRVHEHERMHGNVICTCRYIHGSTRQALAIRQALVTGAVERGWGEHCRRARRHQPGGRRREQQLREYA